MLKLKVLLTSLTILFVLCAPALAQSAPAAEQYATAAGTERCPDGGANAGVAGETDTASAGDGACASAENAGQGSDALNDALTGTASSASASATDETPASSASASPASAQDGSSADGENGATNGEDEGDDGVPASITELPETGGIPLAALGVGVALVASGLAARRVVGG